MGQQVLDSENGILSGIKEGMTVYDSENQKLGTVYKLHFGASSQIANEQGQGAATAIAPDTMDESFFNEFVNALLAGASLPKVVRERLILNGFIRINGLFNADRYAMPEDIANVEGQTVHLKVTGHSLIKG